MRWIIRLCRWDDQLGEIAIVRYLLFIIALVASGAGMCEDARSLSPVELAYRQELTEKIRPLIFLPPQLKGAKEAASVQIVLSIHANGVSDQSVKTLTGPKAFSDALLQAIVKAEPLPVPPAELLKDGIYKVTITYSVPAKVTAEQRSLNDGFPNTYVAPDPLGGGGVRTWRRIILWGSGSSRLRDPQLSPGNLLIRPDQGAAVVYTAPGPAMKPGAELDDVAEQTYVELRKANPELAKMLTGRVGPSEKKILEGQPRTASAYFALLLKRDSEFTLLPLNYVANDPKSLILKRGIGLGPLRSQYDAALDRYLIYQDVLFFSTPSYDSSISSWEHFDAWWLDAKNATIEHIVLPPGPWVTDAKLDGLFLRDVRNFSCGTDCYRHYALKVDSGNVFATISGRPSAISESVTGTYKLKPGSKAWEKEEHRSPGE